MSNVLRHSEDMRMPALGEAPMASWNAVVRLGIELAALAGLATGGWALGQGPMRWIAAMGLPVMAAVLWGTSRVPDDPGPAPVAVPGWVRLLIESVVLAGGVIGFAFAFGRPTSIGFAVVILAHYTVGWERLRWLLER